MSINAFDFKNFEIDLFGEKDSFEETAAVVETNPKEVAVIGIALKMPGADNLEKFWNKLIHGVDCVGELPQKRKEHIEHYLKYKGKNLKEITYLKGAFLDEIDKFDYDMFRLTPKEASLMNPNQRLFLETAWEALEDAGYAGKRITGSQTGVYVGYIGDFEGYKYKEIISEVDGDSAEIAVPGNLSSIIPSRISYLLDLKGPSMLIDTACSSSLVAVHLALRGIRNGDCDMAIAGGVKVNLFPLESDIKVGIESSSGKARTFDDNCDGTSVGEGVVAILLKQLDKALEDGDNIYAVIKGSAVNQDGSSIGITAPNVSAQTDVIVKAWRDAGIDPETISYIEAHGTGTKLGDPIEVEGIKKAFERYTSKKQFCAIGALKTNMGHSFEAAGISSLIKAILALKHGIIPPTINFDTPNRRISFEDSPVYVNDRLLKWQTDGLTRRCGVSSFGFSGTNCHVILEEHTLNSNCKEQDDLPVNILTLSAKNSEALKTLIKKYAEFIDKNKDIKLKDICYTASTGRAHYSHRLALIIKNYEELRKVLKRLEEEKDFSNLIGECIYYGDYRVVPFDKKNKLDNDITDEKLKAITEKANNHLREYISSGKSEHSLLNETCTFYAMGADVDWDILFRREKVKKVSLPLYPFQKESCWLEIPHLDEITDAQNMYYQIVWEERQLEKNTGDNTNGKTLIFKDEEGRWKEFALELENRGFEVIEVGLGVGFEQEGPAAYTINNSFEAYEKLLESIGIKSLKRIIHFSSLSKSECTSLSELENSMEKGLYSLFNLVKALYSRKLEHPIELLAVSEYAYEVMSKDEIIKPQNAPLFGLSKVAAQENGLLKLKCIDIDINTDIKEIVFEIGNNKNKDIHIAFRNGKRYIQVLKPLDVSETNKLQVTFLKDGVYVISGGAGGIGLEVAKILALQGKVKLALINRTPMPDRVQWDDILHEGKNEKLCKRINAIKEIEKTGSEVISLSCDITNFEEVKVCLDTLRKDYGKIKGIIHSAGVPGEGFLVKKDRCAMEKVLAPKVTGTWILDSLTKQDDLDFFILFSSAISMLGVPGQADYAAANAYLDSFAAFRNKTGRKTLSINWVAWKDTGMALDEGFSSEVLFQSLPTSKAVNSFMELLNSQVQRALVGEINYNEQTLHILESLPIEVSPEIISRAREVVHSSRTTNRNFLKISEDVKLKGREDRGYSYIEKQLAQIYKDVMGFKEISIYDNFFELGGDSILLTRVHAQLVKLFPGKITVADLFSYPTICKLAEYIEMQQGSCKEIIIEDISGNAPTNEKDIAIIGVSAKFPKAENIHEFWENIKKGMDCIHELPEERREDIEGYINKYLNLGEREISFFEGGYLEEIDKFDYRFFRLTPKEASMMDPNHRLFLECVWHAFEDAGYSGKKLAGSKTGIYVGFAKTAFDYDRIISDINPFSLSSFISGNLSAIIPSRISYILNLKGPTMVIDTACSSALVALHSACRALRNGDCHMAVAGGIKINLLPLRRHGDEGIGIESSDDRARTFDDSADGTGIGEGVGVVILKQLNQAIKDGDNIYAVIKGSAINQDGSSAGLTAPNSLAQADVITDAWKDAGINPETLAYIEAHGTGTKLGDPIEIDGLQKAFSRFTSKKQFCAIGSVKSNVGHLYEAAGMASLIKVVMALKHKMIPQSIHFEKPNRRIEFSESPVYVSDRLRAWEDDSFPMRCGVSAFGLSGTNCHMVLEEAPGALKAKNPEGNSLMVFTLSAKTENSIKKLAAQYAGFLETNRELDLKDVCYTALTGRDHYNIRVALLVRDLEELWGYLNNILSGEPYSNEIFYREHRIVASGNSAAKDIDITEEKIRIISSLANNKLREYVEAGKKDESLLKEVCRLYIEGADIDWDILFVKDNIKRISLPGYSFEKSRCWLEIPASPKEKISRNMFYSIGWIQDELMRDTTALSNTQVIIMDSKGFGAEVAKHLINQGISVVEVYVENRFQKINNSTYIIGNSPEHYEKLLSELKEKESINILHLLSLDIAMPSCIGELESIKPKCLGNLFYLAKALNGASNIERIFVISRYAYKVTGNEEEINPISTSLFGLTRVLAKEYPQIVLRCIDADNAITTIDIVSEIGIKSGDFTVSYRRGTRYVEEFRPINMEDVPSRNIDIKDSGIYIITGGTGGIGLEVAGLLASKNRVNIALLNRSRFPERREWDNIIWQNQDKKLCNKIKSIRKIEEKGSKVVLVSTDISRMDEVKSTLDELRKVYGKINGIIHSAGVSGYHLLREQKETSFMEMTLPKIDGTINLDNATSEDNMDFFILFSSVASYFSGQGQGAYSAANAFLDGFAAFRTKAGKPTLSINWATWKETGMALDMNFNIDTLFKALPTGKAINALDDILNKDMEKVIIGELNFEGGMANILDRSGFRLSKNIRSKLDDIKHKSKERHNLSSGNNAGNISLKGKEDEGLYSETEKNLASICREILGFEEIDVHENFFEMGGDSILLAKLHSRIEGLYPAKTLLTDLFEYPSVFKLAQYINSKEKDKKPVDSEIEKTVDVRDEVTSLIDELEKGNMSMDDILNKLSND